jgi:hypothetical protein
MQKGAKNKPVQLIECVETVIASLDSLSSAPSAANQNGGQDDSSKTMNELDHVPFVFVNDLS